MFSKFAGVHHEKSFIGNIRFDIIRGGLLDEYRAATK